MTTDNKKALLNNLIYARFSQLFYHYCHNLTSGDNFFADHQFFNDNYDRLESDYDLLTEYYISLFGANTLPTKIINNNVTSLLNQYDFEKMSVTKMLEDSYKIECMYQQYLETLDNVSSLGVKNAVGDICQASDNRKYKIKQRLR